MEKSTAKSITEIKTYRKKLQNKTTVVNPLNVKSKVLSLLCFIFDDI